MDIESLREREKELRCLYRVQQLTLSPTTPLEEVFEQVVESLGAGWQRPETTGACIEYFGREYRSHHYALAAPQLVQSLTLGSKKIGEIRVSDSASTQSQGRACYLPEEIQLLKSIASLLSNFIEWRHLELLGKRLRAVSQSHWQWRERLATDLIARMDGVRFGPTKFFLGGSTERGEAWHGSDIDLYLYHTGSSEQREYLKIWLDGWSVSAGEMARAQTGEVYPDGIFNFHWLNAEPDIARNPALRKLGETGAGTPPTKTPPRDPADSEIENMVQRTLLGLSHELRNPLTVISTNADLLQRNAPSKIRKESIAEIQRAVSSISTLVTNLVLFLRAETGLEKPHLEEMDLEAFVSAALTRQKLASGETKIVLKTEPCRPVRLNPRMTERILQALISNAARHSQCEEIVVSIRPMPGEQVALAVKDEGRGIEEIHHDKLFEQFYRLESSRDRITGGTGLGLPLARALAKCQNSCLQLFSTPGEGTEVRLVFQAV